MLPDKKTLALKTLSIAAGYAGVSRANNPEQVARFLALFGLPYREDGKPLPFCDAGLSYAACKALADLMKAPYTEDSAPGVFAGMLPILRAHYWYASSACEETRQAAIRDGIYLSSEDAGNTGADILPGWLVLYAWTGSVAHHVGMVKDDETDLIQDLEFNTSASQGSQGNGGCVAIRTRSWQNILGFVRTYGVAN